MNGRPRQPSLAPRSKDGTKSRPGAEDADRKRAPADATERERLDSLAAAKREYRALIESGGASLKGVPVKDINALTEVLIDLHWLKESKSEDRKALVAAIGALLDDIASRHQSPMS